MKALRLFPALLASCLFATFASPLARAEPISINWNGSGETGDVTDQDNWDGTVTGSGTEDVAFGDTEGHTTIYIPNVGVALNNVLFTGAERPAYTFDFMSPTTLTVNGSLSAGSGGEPIIFTNKVGIALSGVSHEVNLVSNSSIVIDGVVSNVSGNAAVHLTGSGTLELNGANTFSGGIDLAGGWLLLGHDTAAGSGTLTLSSGTLAPVANITLANNVTLNGGIKLGDCDTTNSIAFNGAISGTGAFDLHGYGDVTFSGNNTGWSGGVEFYGANHVYVANSKGLGTGPVIFDSSSDTVLEINPGITASIGSLSGADYEYNAEIKLSDSASLTINQSTDGEFQGYISGYNDGSTDAGLVKNGSGTLTLSGGGSYSGNTVINAGTLVANGDHADNQLGYGAVTVKNGATLELKDAYLDNSSVSVESGAKLTGYGQIGDNSGSATTFLSGGVLSPGSYCAPIGQLAFDHLTLQSGAIYEWNLQNPNGSEGCDWDLVSITEYASTLHIDSTAGSKLTLKLISLNGSGLAGTATGFEYGTYSWMIFNGGGTPIQYASGAFDPALFDIDDSAFVTDLGSGSGLFSLTSDGYNIYLNFTPVPEPSTYALLAFGAGLTGFAAWRKRRRA